MGAICTSWALSRFMLPVPQCGDVRVWCFGPHLISKEVKRNDLFYLFLSIWPNKLSIFLNYHLFACVLCRAASQRQMRCINQNSGYVLIALYRLAEKHRWASVTSTWEVFFSLFKLRHLSNLSTSQQMNIGTSEAYLSLMLKKNISMSTFVPVSTYCRVLSLYIY